MIFLMSPWIWLASIYFCWKKLYLCSSRILIYSFYLVFSWSFSYKVVLMIFWISLISVVMAHFLFLILLIWVFSFFWFISVKFCQSRLFCPRASSLFLWFFILFFVFIPLILALHGFFPLTDFEFGLLTFLQDSKVHCYLFDIILIVLRQL